MTSPSSLLALEGKLVEAKGPDREIDALLHRQATPDLSDTIIGSDGWLIGGKHEHPTCSPYYTSSIDSALALVSRCLPGCVREFAEYPDGKCYARVIIANDEPPQVFEGHGTPALAICLALVRSLKGAGE